MICFAFFYLLVERNNAQSQPIIVQPSNQLAIRVRVIFVLSCPDWRAKYAGIKITRQSNKIAIIYFIYTTILN